MKATDFEDLKDFMGEGNRSFRDFSDSHVSESIRDRVRRTYFAMHTYQTVEFVKNRVRINPRGLVPLNPPGLVLIPWSNLLTKPVDSPLS